MGGAGGGATEVRCARCDLALGEWRGRDDERAFLPNTSTTRGVTCGDGWTRVRCRRCDHKTTIRHRREAA